LIQQLLNLSPLWHEQMPYDNQVTGVLFAPLRRLALAMQSMSK